MKLDECLKLVQSYIGFLHNPELFKQKYPKIANAKFDPFAYDYKNHDICIKRPHHTIPISLYNMIDAFTSKEPQNQFLTIIINQQEYPYKFSVEDILADDWELIAFPIIDFKEWFDDTLNIKTFNEIEREINNA